MPVLVRGTLPVPTRKDLWFFTVDCPAGFSSPRKSPRGSRSIRGRGAAARIGKTLTADVHRTETWGFHQLIAFTLH